jgi:DNA end-binding protein Ku
MAARAVWKGYLKLGELNCPVALHAAASQSERVALHRRRISPVRTASRSEA